LIVTPASLGAGDAVQVPTQWLLSSIAVFSSPVRV
jgi:hypothetical protein